MQPRVPGLALLLLLGVVTMFCLSDAAPTTTSLVPMTPLSVCPNGGADADNGPVTMNVTQNSTSMKKNHEISISWNGTQATGSAQPRSPHFFCQWKVQCQDPSTHVSFTSLEQRLGSDSTFTFYSEDDEYHHSSTPTGSMSSKHSGQKENPNQNQINSTSGSSGSDGDGQQQQFVLLGEIEVKTQHGRRLAYTTPISALHAVSGMNNSTNYSSAANYSSSSTSGGRRHSSSSSILIKWESTSNNSGTWKLEFQCLQPSIAEPSSSSPSDYWWWGNWTSTCVGMWDFPAPPPKEDLLKKPGVIAAIVLSSFALLAILLVVFAVCFVRKRNQTRRRHTSDLVLLLSNSDSGGDRLCWDGPQQQLDEGRGEEEEAGDEGLIDLIEMESLHTMSPCYSREEEGGRRMSLDYHGGGGGCGPSIEQEE